MQGYLKSDICNSFRQVVSIFAESVTCAGAFNNHRKRAFTLAEVLITLGIIGVVASMTIPTLVQKFQQHSYDTASNVFTRKLGEALKLMNLDSTLAGYDTTMDFVNALSKKIKIIKICQSDNLKECFASQFSTNVDTFKTEELKQAKNLNKDGNYGTETVGVIFADGVSALIAYNQKAKEDPFNNRVVNIISSGDGIKNRTIGLSTDALAILYDVSGSSDSNIYSVDEDGNYKDIRGINVSIKIGADILYIPSYAPVNCSDSSSRGYEYCTGSTRGTDYRAGTRLVCADQQMRAPTISELLALVEKSGQDGIPSAWSFWPSDGDSHQSKNSFVTSDDGGLILVTAMAEPLSGALCVAD